MADWTQVFVIIGVFVAFFIYVLSRMDTKIDHLETKLDTKMENLEKRFEAKFESLQKDNSKLFAKLSNIEGQIMQMTRPKIVPLSKEEDIKEN